ncbi:McrC family protein [Dietzia maris]|uniref:Restriction endonuclease n=1 Tax=Dietzia maris TaxID=37915 RepID=A0ABT8H5G9_9ACTN|nr:hypothetical protein [Dietzia maris]MDN4507711.1 hypothetical protein [Dietzia maris]
MADALADNPPVQLHEYGAAVVLSVEEVDLSAIIEANSRWKRALNLPNDPIRIVDVSHSRVSLRAEGVTGVVRAGRTEIQISPKFLSSSVGSWQSVLWRILSVVEGGYVDEGLSSAQESALPMPDLLAEIFLTSYQKGAARGLPRGYVTKCSTGRTLRGSLDLSRIGEWLIAPWDIPYTSDVLTDDTALSRLLRWAADTLSTAVKSPDRSHALREIVANLSHVSRRPPHLIDAQRLELGTQHQGLEAARLVGVLLLDGAGVEHSRGEHKLSGFLWKSDLIYENYIYWLSGRAAAKLGLRVSKQAVAFGKLIAGEGRRLETIPDVVFRSRDGTVAAVTDSKYKVLGTRPKSSDTYQVLTAGHVLGCSRVSLTYPVSVPRDATVWRVQSALGGDDIELTALPLNLMCLAQPNGPDVLVEKIVAWLSAAVEGEKHVTLEASEIYEP